MLEKFISKSYLRFVRMHPCAVCRKEDKIEADHLEARGRESANQNDLATLPLCRRHHDERHLGGRSKIRGKVWGRPLETGFGPTHRANDAHADTWVCIGDGKTTN